MFDDDNFLFQKLFFIDGQPIFVEETDVVDEKLYITTKIPIKNIKISDIIFISDDGIKINAVKDIDWSFNKDDKKINYPKGILFHNCKKNISMCKITITNIDDNKKYSMDLNITSRYVNIFNFNF